MAFELTVELLGAFLSVLGRNTGAASRRVREVTEWLDEVTVPPPGVVVRAGGGTYSGLLLIVRNRVRRALLFCHPMADGVVVVPAPIDRPNGVVSTDDEPLFPFD